MLGLCSYYTDTRSFLETATVESEFCSGDLVILQALVRADSEELATIHRARMEAALGLSQDPLCTHGSWPKVLF